MKIKTLSSALLTAVLAVTLNAGIATVLLAASAQEASATSKKPAKKAKKSKGGKITFDRGSEESTGERTSRLKRECKGRNNAGACAGFGQGS